MPFPIIVYRMSIWVSGWLCIQGACWPVITVIFYQWSDTYYGVWGLVVFLLQICGCARWVFGRGECPDILLSQFAADGCYLVWRGSEHESFFKVMVTWTDLVSFNFISHFLSHDWISRKCNGNLWEVIAGFSGAIRTTVSSAKVAVVLSAVVGRWAGYRR